MFDLDHWREMYDGLSRNKLRTFLTAFGVFWGVFMLTLMLGSGTGLENGVTHGFSDSATNSLFVWTRATTKPYHGLGVGRRFSLDNSDTAAIREAVPEAAVIAPRNQLGGYQDGNNVTRGLKAGAFSVMGDHPEIRSIQPMRLTRGRFLDLYDLAERRKVAVIGSRVAEVLFLPGEDPIGEHVRIAGVYFKVIGVFEPTQSGEDAQEKAQTIHVPFTTFQTAFNYGERVGWYALTAKEGIAASTVEKRVLALLARRHQVSPDDERAFGHFNVEEEYLKVQGVFRGIRALIWIVGIGTLAAGVIGVSNIMLVIVRERTSEFGIRRAIGATPYSVIRQVLVEALLLTLLAGYTGLICGVGLVDLVSHFMGEVETSMFRQPDVGLKSALEALCVVVVAGTLAGVMPALRAVRIRPVEALRMDA